MAIHWQVKFRSLRSNELYTVSIYDEYYTGTPVQLTGAAQPFETQEDNGDIFTPVLTQSGYLRIVDTGKDNAGNAFNWRSFIPTNDIDRPVKMTDGNGNTVWMGFLQAQNFGSTLFELPQVREFPLQCPLTVASRNDVSLANTDIHNFAYLLLMVIDCIPSVCRPNMFYFQGTNATEYLKKRIDWQNFAQVDKDEAHSSYGLLNCLQELCKFWGWSARTYREAVYFVSPDDADNYFCEVNYTTLQYIATDHSFFVQNTPYSLVTFGNDIFASTSNTDFQMRGPNTVKITANSNEADSEVISIFPENVLEQMEAGGTYTEQYSDKRAIFTNDITSFTSPLMTGSCANSPESFNIMTIDDGSGFSGGGGSSTHNTIRIRHTYNGNVLVSLQTVFEHTFYSGGSVSFMFGGIVLSGDIYRKGDRYEYATEAGAGKSHVYFRIGIGSSRSNALWYNGNSSWVSTPTAFQVTVGGSDNNGFTWAATTNNTALKGRIFIDILGSDDMRHDVSTSYPDLFELVDLTLTFIRPNEGKKLSSREYVAHNDTMVKEEYTDETIFATDNGLKFGYALLMNTDGSMFKGIDYDGSSTLVPPEQHLADRIADYWASSKRKMEVELLANKNMTVDQTTAKIVAISPGMKATLDSTSVYPVSISHEWRDDIVNITFTEI